MMAIADTVFFIISCLTFFMLFLS